MRSHQSLLHTLNQFIDAPNLGQIAFREQDTRLLLRTYYRDRWKRDGSIGVAIDELVLVICQNLERKAVEKAAPVISHRYRAIGDRA